MSHELATKCFTSSHGPPASALLRLSPRGLPRQASRSAPRPGSGPGGWAPPWEAFVVVRRAQELGGPVPPAAPGPAVGEVSQAAQETG